MELDSVQFLDLLHFYRLKTAEEPEKASQLLTGSVEEQEKPAMLTEEAKKIRVPSWWKGGTTISEAQMIVTQAKEARAG